MTHTSGAAKIDRATGVCLFGWRFYWAISEEAAATP